MTGVMRMLLLLQAGPCRLCCFRAVLAAPRRTPRSPHCTFATDGQSQSQKENERTVQQLCKLSIDIRKIRRSKGWVLLQEDSYVEEVVRVLQGLGADSAAVASVLERCPEAMLCSPATVATQRDLWQLVCSSKRELARLIERFPEAFFTAQDQENLGLNIQLFQELGLRNKVICRLLTTASSIFHRPVERNKQMVQVLQDSYLHRGGAEANLKVWLLKLLSQNPFILFSSPAAVRETLESLQEQGFTNSEILQLLSKLKGFLFQLCPRGIQNNISFLKNVLECTDHDLKQLVLKCPALLFYSIPVLEERIQGLGQEGISIAQIRETPMILELTPEIVQYRIRKLNSLGYRIKDGHLADLNGTKREFEANFGRIQAKRERPLFNPVAPLDIEG